MLAKKIRLILFVLLLLGISEAKADFEPVLEYKVRFELKNSTSFEAYYLTNDDPAIKNDIENLDSLLLAASMIYYDTITIYLDIIPMDSLGIEVSGRVLHATSVNEIKRINVHDILKTTVLSYKTYPWSCNNIIRGLSRDEIQKLKNNKPALVVNYTDCFKHNLIGVYIVSFDNSITEDTIISMFNSECCSNPDEVRESASRMEDGYLKLKAILNEKNIIVFKYCTGN